MPTGYTLKRRADYTTGFADTLPASGSAPQAASAGRGITGMTDRGNPSTGLCCYSIQSGKAVNGANVTFPGVGANEFPNNGADYAGDAVTLPSLWMRYDSSQMGPYIRSASGHTLGFFLSTNTAYLRGKDPGETSANSIVDWNASHGLTLSAGQWLRLDFVEVTSTSMQAIMSVYASGVNPESADPGSPLWTDTQTVNLSGGTRAQLLGAVTAGFASFTSGSTPEFAIFDLDTALAIGALSVVDRGDKCVTIQIPSPTGGTGDKTINLRRAEVVGGTVGSYSTLAADVASGNYDDTTVEAGKTYSYQAVVTDDTDTATGIALQVDVLSLTEPKWYWVGDSNYQIPPYGSGVTSVQSQIIVSQLEWIGIDSVVKSYAVAGTTSTNWNPAGGSGFDQLSQLVALAAHANKYCSSKVVVGIGLGTNNTKTSIGTDKATYKSDLAAIIAWLQAEIDATSLTVMMVTPCAIPASVGGDWDADSDGLLLEYIEAMQELIAPGVVLADDPATGTSWHGVSGANPAAYGADNNVHPGQAGQTEQAHQIFRYVRSLYIGGGNGSTGDSIMESEQTVIGDLPADWDDAAKVDGPVTIGFQPIEGDMYYVVGTATPAAGSKGRFIRQFGSRELIVPTGKSIYWRSVGSGGKIAYDLKNN